MEVVPKKFKYKQKMDSRGSMIEGVYTLVPVCVEIQLTTVMWWWTIHVQYCREVEVCFVTEFLLSLNLFSV